MNACEHQQLRTSEQIFLNDARRPFVEQKEERWTKEKNTGEEEEEEEGEEEEEEEDPLLYNKDYDWHSVAQRYYQNSKKGGGSCIIAAADRLTRLALLRIRCSVERLSWRDVIINHAELEELIGGNDWYENGIDWAPDGYGSFDDSDSELDKDGTTSKECQYRNLVDPVLVANKLVKNLEKKGFCASSSICYERQEDAEYFWPLHDNGHKHIIRKIRGTVRITNNWKAVKAVKRKRGWDYICDSPFISSPEDSVYKPTMTKLGESKTNVSENTPGKRPKLNPRDENDVHFSFHSKIYSVPPPTTNVCTHCAYPESSHNQNCINLL